MVQEQSKSPNILLMSSSQGIHGSRHLIHFLKDYRVKQVLFIPFAAYYYDWQTMKVSNILKQCGFRVEGIQYKKDPVEAIETAEAIYVGGGNTFLLLKAMYDLNLMDALRKRVLEDGVPFVGSSAGANVATCSIHTTNDMPIVFPPSFDGLGLVPFNINPHYSETSVRDGRIQDYVELHDNVTVGMREGSSFLICDGKLKLLGLHRIKIFSKGQEPREYHKDFDLNFLLRGEAPKSIERQYTKVFV